MKKKLLAGIMAIILCSMTGCNSQKDYDALLDRKNELALQYNDLLAEKKQIKADYDALLEEKEQLETDYETLQTDYNELNLLYKAETEVTYEKPTDLSDYATDITYEHLARTPDDYKGKAICMYGEVVQLIEGDGSNDLRVALNGDYDEIVYFTYDPNVIETRVLEGDDITIYGNYYGIYSYQSTLGATISIPLIIGTYVEIN